MSKITKYIQHCLLLCFKECTCNVDGEENGDQCAHVHNGHCECKFGVTGNNCDTCRDGFWDFGQDSDWGCKGKALILTLKQSLFD